MIDDLKTHKVEQFEWLWHPGGEARKQDTDLNITNGNSSVVVRPLYPRLLVKSDFVYDYPEDWIGLRVRNKGKITDIYINQLADGRLIHSNSWIEADGWFTDAYMFTVTYEEGTNPADSKELFICYGSGLRRDKIRLPISRHFPNCLSFRKKRISN